MPRKLKNLVIRQIALVDRGACQEADILIAKRAPDAIRKLVGTPVVAAMGSMTAAELRSDVSLRSMICSFCGVTRDVSVFTLANDPSEAIYASCRTCKRNGIVQRGRLVPVPESNQKALLAIEIQKNMLAIEANREARRALRQEMGPRFTTHEDDSMSATQVIQKAFAAGDEDAVIDGVEDAVDEWAAILFARGGLTVEKAKSDAWDMRLWPFRPASDSNPTFRKLWRAKDSAVLVEAREANADAEAALDRLARELQAQHPDWTYQKAYANGLQSERGAKLFKLHTRAADIVNGQEDA